MKDFFGVVLALALAAGLAVSSAAANNVDACREQVKAYAQYNETSWWARHQMLKKCIADPNHVCRQC